MDMVDRAHAACTQGATVDRVADLSEDANAIGHYIVECFGVDGQFKWVDYIKNVVCTEGKNEMLDVVLAGIGYSVTGPFMGLISNISFTAVSAGDVGTQINGTNGWKEAGGANAPTYGGNRKTCAWSAASGGAKSLSSPLQFLMTGSGTIKGAFILFTGATNVKDDAHGTLWSAGLFAGGDKIVGNGDTVNVSYTTSL